MWFPTVNLVPFIYNSGQDHSISNFGMLRTGTKLLLWKCQTNTNPYYADLPAVVTQSHEGQTSKEIASWCAVPSWKCTIPDRALPRIQSIKVALNCCCAHIIPETLFIPHRFHLRKLRARGIGFQTDNDVIAAVFEWLQGPYVAFSECAFNPCTIAAPNVWLS